MTGIVNLMVVVILIMMVRVVMIVMVKVMMVLVDIKIKKKIVFEKKFC